MNPIGCHGLVWTDQMSPEVFRETVRRTAAAGFTLLEVPLMDPWGFDATEGRRVLAEHGLTATLSVGLEETRDISESLEQAKRGEELLVQALRQAEALGATHMTGVLFSQLKRYAMPVTAAGRAQAQAVLGRVADRAADVGVTLALETVNRYETNVFNTLRDSAGFAAEIGRSNVKIHIDTFHMNIEETDLYQPVLDVADSIGYVHVSENTRGYLGSGGIAFNEFFRALAAIGYSGPVTFETFSASMLRPEFAGLLAVWRSFYEDADALAAHAAAFIRNGLAAAAQVERNRH